MKFRSLCAFLLTLTTIFSAAAQDRQTAGPTAADFFYRAPVAVASGFPEISRLDMVDYFTNGSTVKSENRLGQKVGIKSLRVNMIVWQDDDSVETAIAVIPTAKADTMLVVIRTVQSPLADSELSMYDKAWKPVDDKNVPQPKLKDWLATTDRQAVAKVEDAVPFMLVTTEFDPELTQLVFTNRTADYFAPSDMPDALRHLKKELRYQWDGAKFKPLK